MKHIVILVFALAIAPLTGYASQRMIPAGSLIQCTVSEPKLSSKTTAIGDPVLCHVGHAERFGRTTLPYYSALVGRFEDYSDPGHFVGKGWMELRFDRLVIEPDTSVPIEAKVIAVPGYNVDRDGRILGKGHVVRDVVAWSIPILWPIDLLMLPRRGPRPTLKAEIRLTLKVMDDLMIPVTDQPQPDPHGLMHRVPSAVLELPPPPTSAQEDSEPVTARADDPTANDAQPGTEAYSSMPVAPPRQVMAFLPYVPAMVAPRAGRREYRSPQFGPTTRARAYQYPRRIAQPPRARAYNFGAFGYGANRSSAGQRTHIISSGQRGMAGSYGGRGAFRGGGGRR